MVATREDACRPLLAVAAAVIPAATATVTTVTVSRQVRRRAEHQSAASGAGSNRTARRTAAGPSRGHPQALASLPVNVPLSASLLRARQEPELMSPALASREPQISK